MKSIIAITYCFEIIKLPKLSQLMESNVIPNGLETIDSQTELDKKKIFKKQHNILNNLVFLVN